jgi:hypothetical protein
MGKCGGLVGRQFFQAKPTSDYRTWYGQYQSTARRLIAVRRSAFASPEDNEHEYGE